MALYCINLLLLSQEYAMTEYLRMSGMYWGLTVMDLMNALPRMDRAAVLDFIKQCQQPGGGISASLGHDPHLLYTLSAVQVLGEQNINIPPLNR